MHHRGVDHHVVVDEFSGAHGVGHDAADGAGDEIDVFGTIGAEPVVDRRLIAKIELIARRGQDVRVAELIEPPADGGADEAAVAGNEDPGGEVHLRHCPILSVSAAMSASIIDITASLHHSIAYEDDGNFG